MFVQRKWWAPKRSGAVERDSDVGPTAPPVVTASRRSLVGSAGVGHVSGYHPLVELLVGQELQLQG